jgi:hypothetical protein
MPSKVAFLKARVEAFKSVLDRATPKEREGRVSKHLADEFNTILKEIGEECPDAAPHLPKPVRTAMPMMAKVGLSEIGYVDLLVMAEQVLRVLSVVESHG